MDSLNTTSKVLLALAHVDELAIKKKTEILSTMGDLSLLPHRRDDLTRIMGAENTAQFFEIYADIDGVVENLKKHDVHWFTILDDDYPDNLREIDGAPIVLFFKGSADAFKADSISVVGPRRPTHYGEKAAEQFSREFARAGLTVVSGFARGIDSVAHKACVAQGSPTIAVFACGLDICYPAEHKGLGDAIIENGGALVSEYPLGTKPLQYHFPDRNRIVSGLSRAIFLPEAAKKSGSLISMRFAIEQGKDIFILPGNIYAAESEGSNELLRELPHALAIDPSDVLNALGIKSEKVAPEVVELSIEENQIVDALRDGEKHFEDLLEISNLSVGELTNLLFNLELNGITRNTGGNYYALA